MPFTNFDSRHFAAADKTAVNTAIASLETALAAKLANLEASERQQYGSVNETNKLIINKVKEFRDSQPTLSSPDVDWTEFANDHDTRMYLQTTMQRLQSLLDGLGNAKILHDWDNYQASLTDYDYAKYKSGTQATGFETKVNEISQFFQGGPTARKEQQ
jgi:CHAT domain-containing protein